MGGHMVRPYGRKNPLPFLYGLSSENFAVLSRERGDSQEGGNLGVYPLVPQLGRQDLFTSQAKISRFKTDLSSLHNLMRSPALIQLLPNRGKHPLCHIQIPADLQLINLKRQVGWIPRLNI